MEYRNKLSILGYGCMRFPKKLGSVEMDKCEELILSAVDKGINYFDTAYIYDGSEVALGSVIKKNNLRDKIYIATKLPLFLIHSSKDFDKYFNEQLKRLQTDYIDYYLMHAMSDLAGWEHLCKLGIKEWLEDKKKKGIIKNIGFSFHGSRDEFIKIINAYSWDFTQIQYNYVNEYYQAGLEGLKEAYKKKIPVIVMEPLLGGKLVNGLSKNSKEIFKSVANYSLVEWALKWLWDQSEVTCVLSGMSKLSDLEENVKIANKSKEGMLTKKERDAYKKVVEDINNSKQVPCTGCNYCMPCPANVNIPACFASYNTSHNIGYFAGIKEYLMTTGVMGVKQSKASLCIKCGKCESHCPQSIKIRDNLTLVKKRLEPFWYRGLVSITRKVLKRDKSI